MKRILMAAITIATLAIPGAALAYWPSPQVSVRATPGPQKCSVTAAGPQIEHPLDGVGYWYGGGTSCAPPPAPGMGVFKSLNVVSQVLGPDHKTWFTKTGSRLTASGWGSPVRVSGAIMAAKGHTYRVVATATLEEPNGHAGCTLSKLPFACYQKVAVTSISAPVTAT